MANETKDSGGAIAMPWNGLWGVADQNLASAQAIIEHLMANNSDEYGLLSAALDHVVMARGDLDADLK